MNDENLIAWHGPCYITKVERKMGTDIIYILSGATLHTLEVTMMPTDKFFAQVKKWKENRVQLGVHTRPEGGIHTGKQKLWFVPWINLQKERMN